LGDFIIQASNFETGSELLETAKLGRESHSPGHDFHLESPLQKAFRAVEKIPVAGDDNKSPAFASGSIFRCNCCEIECERRIQAFLLALDILLENFHLKMQNDFRKFSKCKVPKDNSCLIK
jgi:hypothetical protein